MLSENTALVASNADNLAQKHDSLRTRRGTYAWARCLDTHGLHDVDPTSPSRRLGSTESECLNHDPLWLRFLVLGYD